MKLLPIVCTMPPIHVHEEQGFKCVVILPKGTNTAIDFEPGQEGED
jgi:hypothetical protein